MATEFIQRIRSSGGEFTTLTAWEAALQIDLTASTTRIFRYELYNGTLSPGDSVEGASSGATATLLGISTPQSYVLLDVTSGTFSANETIQEVGATGNNVTATNDQDSAISVAECYDDWASGLDDQPVINGSTTSATNYIEVRPADGEGHTGVPDTGFFISKDVTSNYVVSVSDDYVRITGLDIVNTTATSGGGINTGGIRGTTISKTIIKTKTTGIFVSTSITASDIVIKNCLLRDCGAQGINYGGTSYTITVDNCTSLDCAVGFRSYSSGAVILRNSVAYGAATASFSGTFATGSKNNTADDAETTTPPGTDPITTDIVAADFRAVASDDVRLPIGIDTTSTLYLAGADLGTASDYTGIDGNSFATRDSAEHWSVGAARGTVEEVFDIRSSLGDYTTLTAWESARQADLTALDVVCVADCYNDWASGLTDALYIDGWTTDANRYTVVRGSETAGSQGASRHDGTAGTGFRVTNATAWAQCFRGSEQYMQFEYLSAAQTNNYASFNFVLDVGNFTCTLKNCLSTDSGNGTGSAGFNTRRCTLICCASLNAGLYGFSDYANYFASKYYNCVAADCVTGFNGLTGSDVDNSSSKYINCVAHNCTTNWSITSFRTGSGYNASSDYAGDAPPGLNNYTSDTVDADFEDDTNQDFHLASGSGLIDQGSDLTSLFTEDIDGDTWPDGSAWDIGFDYYLQTTVSLLLDNSAHGHTAGNATLSQVHSLLVANAAHAHTATVATLNQIHDLVVADAAHAHAAQNVTLSQIHALVVDAAQHGHIAENATLSQIHTLSVDAAQHAHTAQNATLSQIHDLLVDAAQHGHTAENVTLAQLHALVVEDAAHAHTAENVVLSQIHDLIVQSALHGHTSSTVTLAQVHTLILQNAQHGHTSENATLSQIQDLIVANAQHGHTATEVILSQLQSLLVSDSAHAHTSTEAALSQIHDLIVTAAQHGHLADNATLEHIQWLLINSAQHEHVSSEVLLSQINSLLVVSAQHGHTSQNVTLEHIHQLVVSASLHGHIADNVLLTQVHDLVVAAAQHGHTSSEVLLAHIHQLVVNAANHGHIADNTTLSQLHSVLIDAAQHGHTSTATTLSQVHTLLIDAAAHAHLADNVYFGQTNELVIQLATHGHTAGNVTLNQLHDVLIDSAAHGHTVDVATFLQVHSLLVNGAVHDHTAANVIIDHIVRVLANDSAHGHTAANALLSQIHDVLIADAQHGLSSSIVTFDEIVLLFIQSAAHSHLGENVDFSVLQDLLIQSATHGHVAETVSIDQDHLLAILDAQHALSSGDATFSQIHDLIVDPANHVHAASNVLISFEALVSADSAVHAHVADQAGISTVYALQIMDALHSQLADSVLFDQHNILVVNDTLHDLLSTSPDVFSTITLGNGCIIMVKAEGRYIIVAQEDRITEIERRSTDGGRSCSTT